MSKIIIGIDPDSKAHGVAIYENGKLITLCSMELMRLLFDLRAYSASCFDLTVHIEDVCANNAAFHKSGVKNARAATAINRSIGKCQQAQIELERACAWYKIKVVKHKISSAWKKNKSQFEKITGWTGRSNEDTRSAAYFGWLGLKS